ncbi:gluconolaconase [Paraherbaspirillum soli]|uniref:Gluconolaconase n=1 Tax=Paraherbaspirillum soli TaxID=631222 RepID=A0ABW0M8Y6_9BURK
MPTDFAWAAQITTVAGDGTPGVLDGTALHARFADPFGLAVDRQGNLYVADAGNNNRIRKITPDGAVTALAGAQEGFADGSAASAAFNTPSGLAIDQAGNVFVADTGNNAIRKITPEGVVTTVAGNGKAGYRNGPASGAQFNGPVGVAVDQRGNVYVADTYNDRIRVIGADGQVKTLAGGDRPGYQDGPAADALFDTPCALVVDAKGDLFIADTKNSAIRKLTGAGEVTTIASSPPKDREALLKRPQGLALTPDGFLYVGDTARGRILQISPSGELRGLTGIGIDVAIGDDTAARLKSPTGIALDRSGALYVADAADYMVRKVTPKMPATGLPTTAHTGGAALRSSPQSSIRAAQPASFPWPLKPQNRWHEIVGTMGEVRGNYDGESRDHFHSGVDVQAAIGTPVLAVADEKTSSVLPNWGYGGLSEGLGIDTMTYIHMRVGRTEKDEPIDPARFIVLNDNDGKPMRVRVKRGTRFSVGDALGTVNRMYHVHLEYSPAGAEVNPLTLSFPGFKDQLPPRIEDIQLFDRAARRLSKKRGGRLLVQRSLGDFSIVVDAYDQMDGNAARRRLGLYKLGYQILHADGTPVRGFEQALVNLEFNRLPPDREAVKIAYADSSGDTVHSSGATRFLYVVTNTVRDGRAKTGSWRAADLPQGDYLIRIFAADYAGNQAINDRDLPITVE